MNQALFWDILRITGQILLLTSLFYWIMRLLKGTPGLAQICSGILFLIFVFLISVVLKLSILRWIVEKVFNALPVILVVLFQGEIRRLLGVFARKMMPVVPTHRHRIHIGLMEQMIDSLCTAAIQMSGTKTGALIAVQQTMDLSTYAKTGKRVDALLTPGNGVLETIFYKGSPLHDGGVVVRDNRIEAAGCVFPLCENENVRNDYGMRHQAATGLSEETDALVLVVSEENGVIHVVSNGIMTAILDHSLLKVTLQRSLHMPEQDASPSYQIFRRVSMRLRAWAKILLHIKKKPDIPTKG